MELTQCFPTKVIAFRSASSPPIHPIPIVVVYYWIQVMKVAAPLANSDTAFPFALRPLALPWGLRSIILAGFIAAVMAAISSLANSTATIFSLDVYRKLINPQASQSRLVL
jgi:SSS family solute:Na+ symporter